VHFRGEQHVIAAVRKARLRAFFLVTALALSLSNVASAQDEAIRIRNWETVLTVNSDGTLYVTERLTIKFTGRSFTIDRLLSVRHKTAEGRERELDIRGLSVTNADGQWHRIVVRPQRDFYEIRIWITPWPVNEDRVVIISYRVTNAIRFFQAGSEKGLIDELYWDVNDRRYRIDKAHVAVVLPTSVVPTGTAVYYTGVNPIPGFNPIPSVAADAKIETNGNAVGMSLPRDLSPGEVMTIAVDWPAGHVTRPIAAPERPGITVIQWWPLLIPSMIFVAVFTTWRRQGRDPEEGSYVVRYEPVEGMSPAELGTLVDNEVNAADLTATLIDLAVRGFLRLEETAATNPIGLGKRVDHIIHIVRKRPEWAGLKLHEQRFLSALSKAAGDSDMVRNSALRDRIVWPERMVDPIYDELISSGYYRNRPDKTKTNWIGVACMSIVVGTLCSQFAFRRSSPLISPVAITIAAVLTSLILFAFAPMMPARTAAGARAREAALGFKEFLTRVQDPHNKAMALSPQMFDRFLPYAIALGVAGHWAKAFDEVYREPPQWYVGGTGQSSASSLSHKIVSMSS
jgi:uncharacterized protein (TIGR04222 family)